jgi:hypothetical protein
MAALLRIRKGNGDKSLMDLSMALGMDVCLEQSDQLLGGFETMLMRFGIVWRTAVGTTRRRKPLLGLSSALPVWP